MTEHAKHILIVEDDLDLREALCDTLDLAGLRVSGVADGGEALNLLGSDPIDMVISDVNMPGMDGHDLLCEVRRRHPQVPMALITAYGSIGKSVQAMRDGAVDYLVKPFAPEVLVETVRRYIGSAGAIRDDDPIAVDNRSLELLQLARRVAVTDSTVLVLGESGTGKEVVARYIHRHSPRCDAPFVAVNCAAIPENMLEAMLFGHEKGAFTGAYNAHAGKFEQADGGTLLLDEVSEMDIGLQAKLLRVLQEREIERLGGHRILPVDVRVLATSNRELREEVSARRFREDLYYRLSVFPLMCLPLRQRPDDILPLANAMALRHAQKMHRSRTSFDVAAQRALIAHDWPGNVRELDNVIQRALILQSGNTIRPADLQIEPFVSASQNIVSLNEPREDIVGKALNNDLRQHELDIIVGALREVGGSKKAASEKLGISPRTLRYKLARMRDSGMDVDSQLARTGP